MPAPWIPILPSALLDPEQVLKITVFEQELALWRSASGRVQIWENRCPHRSVRFSIGKVEGENLICAYHGWAFDAQSTRCQRIPAQPQQRAPQSLCAKAYLSHEAQGMIWFAGFEQQALTYTAVNDALAQYYAGSIMVNCSQQQIHRYCTSLGFIPIRSYVWQARSAEIRFQLYISPSRKHTQQVHLLCHSPQACALAAEFLLACRDHLEQAIDEAS